LAEIAEGAPHQHIVIGGKRAGLFPEISGRVRDDQDFAQREGDALTQLVGTRDRMRPPGVSRLHDGRRINSRPIDERHMRRDRRGELFVEK
jgi:hypothetical protein